MSKFNCVIKEHLDVFNILAPFKYFMSNNEYDN